MLIILFQCWQEKFYLLENSICYLLPMISHFSLFTILRINKNGIPNKIGMLIAINKLWKGANPEIAALVPNPSINENKLPAQVGQPTNNPVNIPKVETAENFFCDWYLNILKKYIFSAKLKPTIEDIDIASIRFRGIISIENVSLNNIVIIGT